MSANQTRKVINQLDRELADLERKLAEEIKKDADKTKRINDTQKSIGKNSSASIIQSKMRQVQGYQNDLVRISRNKADINKKIASKRKNRSEKAVKLQREESAEAKKEERTQRNVQLDYEKRIEDLSAQLKQQTSLTNTTEHIYVHTSDDEEEYDVFVSHAHEDKESFVNELCDALENTGIKVWYDAMSIRWGDSLRSKIDNGLKKSKCGLVIISKDFIKKGWTQYELDGLFQIEMTRGKTILPIWHNITKMEVQEFSPSLAGRLALSTSMMTPQEIVNELKNILGLSNIGGEETDGQA